MMIKTMRRIAPADLAVFLLLVAIAVVGRAERIDWNFTPLAASAVFAGFYFRSRVVAALVPLVALPVGDLIEPGHNNGWVVASVWLAFLVPAILGPWLRSATSALGSLGRGGVAALLPSATFYLLTNFVVWASEPASVWPKTLEGLAGCYAVAVPFYGKMLAGDLFFGTLMFGAYTAAVLMMGGREGRRGSVPQEL